MLEIMLSFLPLFICEGSRCATLVLRFIKQKSPIGLSRSCAPTGIRTLVLALKGLRPGPLDDGGIENGILPKINKSARANRDFLSMKSVLPAVDLLLWDC